MCFPCGIYIQLAILIKVEGSGERTATNKIRAALPRHGRSWICTKSSVEQASPSHIEPTAKTQQIDYKIPSDRNAPMIRNADLRSRSTPTQSPRRCAGRPSSPATNMSFSSSSSSSFSLLNLSSSSRSQSTSSHCESLTATATVLASRMLGSTDKRRLDSSSDVPSAACE